MKLMRKRSFWTFAAAVTSSTFILSSCNPTIQATVEDGIIDVSTSFLAALFQAITQVVTSA